MKHKSTKNVNNNVIKKVYVLFFLLSIIFSQDKIELKQADSLSSKAINQQTVTTLSGNIIFQKDGMLLYADTGVQSSQNNILKLYSNVKIEDKNKTIFCDSLTYNTDAEIIEMFGNIAINESDQTITANNGKINNNDGKIILQNNAKIINLKQRIEGEIIELFFENQKVKTLKVLQNGTIFSNNYGYEKIDRNKAVENEDILKGRFINIEINNDSISEIQLIGMASSLIHLYEDSLYQGINKISGDKINLKLKNNNATNLESVGGVIGQFNPSISNISQQKVDYRGQRVEFDTNTQQSKIFGEANISQVGMDLTAAQINIDWNSNILEAFDKNQHNKNEYLQPTLIENGREPISGKSMIYNIEDRKGKVIAGSTKIQNNLYMGKMITTVTDSTFYIDDCIFTSCDPSKFYIGSKQVKIIYGDKVIAKPLNIVIGGVPIFGIPMAIFPHSNKERRSGWIMPSFGSSENRGNYLDGLGYYFAPNDYFGSENSLIFADRQGVILKSKNYYKKRYEFSGNFNFEVRKHLNSNEQDIAKLNENNKTDFSLNWNHNQTLRKDQSFRSNVSYYSNGEYNRETSIDYLKRLNQQAISNATYSKRWKNKNLSLSVNVSNKQDLMSKNKVNSNSIFYQNPTSLNSTITENNSTLPSINFRIGRRSLFKNSNNPFLSNIQWNYSSRILNNSKNFYESQEIIDNENIIYQWKQDENGNIVTSNKTNAMFKNNFSISAPFTLFKYIAVNPNININSDFVSSFRKVSMGSEDTIEFNEIDKFKNRTTSKMSLSISTKFYGILPFKIRNVTSIRHVMTPSIGFSYSPNYLDNNSYFQEFNDEYYDYFSGSLIGSTPRNSNKKINFSLGNVFQAKYSNRDKEEKINLFSWRINTGYNLNSKEFKLSNLNSSIRSSLKNGTNIDLNLTHDFYEYDSENNARLDKLKSMPRLTGVRLSTNFTIKGEKLNDKNDENFSNETVEFIKNLSSNNWKSRLGISYVINKINPNNRIENFWLNSNTSINVTSNWKLNYNARFNLIDKNIVRHNLTLYREIDCWELFVDWTPNGYAKGLYFRLNLKSDILKDLKVEQKTGIYTTRSTF
ncbi:MAG: putative LPS assembly protein LptD [Candidatus Neomarinimicrobiota bacterium]